MEQFAGKELNQRPWNAEAVHHENGLVCAVKRRFLLLTSYDFEKAFGRPPRARDPKAPMVTLQDVDGSTQQFYCFLDLAHPWRELEVTSTCGEVCSESLMEAKEHNHEQQAVLTQMGHGEKRMGASGCQSLLGNQQWALCSMSDYQVIVGVMT